MSPTLRISLLLLQAADVLFLLLHDWVPLGRLSNLEAIHSVDSRPRLLLTTLLSALPFLFLFAASLVFRNSPIWPAWLRSSLLWAYAILLVGALRAWWIPYLFLPDPVRADRYRTRFAGTYKFLPERNGIAPDTLHVLFHLCLLATLTLLLRA